VFDQLFLPFSYDAIVGQAFDLTAEITTDIHVASGTAGGAAFGTVPGSAVGALVLGAVSLPACLLFGVPAIICGWLALNLAQRTRQLATGRVSNRWWRHLARLGRVCGIVGMALGILVVSFLIAATFLP
ncbi:hypothetical protein LCGC14_2136130, partial [marine sediment metagenome]